MKKIIFGLITLIVAIVAACSVTPKKEADKNVKEFLQDFQDNLGKSDQEVLKMFSTDQFKDQILRAVELFRDKDKVVRVNILFDEFKQYAEDYYILLDLPVDLTGIDQPTERTFFSLRLVPKNGSFLIIGMDVDRFFPAFFSLKSSIENSDQLSQLQAELKPYHDRAKELQKTYDSVIWFVNHDTSTYYYVVNGSYNFDSLKQGILQNYKMGLVDKSGRVIVPVEYDLIKNPSMSLPNALEVSKNGKVGYYSLDGKEMITASYDWVVPFNEGTASALVLKDSIYGWLDNTYKFHENFPSKKAEESIKQFGYLASQTFSYGNNPQGLINVLLPLNEELMHFGNGLVLPSAYLVEVGIFPRFNDGFITKKANDLYQFGNDLLEAKIQKPFSITEVLSGFITEIKKRYIGGRGEFYSEQKVKFLDEKRNLISSLNFTNAKGFSFKKINDSLFQYTHLVDLEYMMGPGDNFPEQNVPYYGYFNFDGKRMYHLSSVRRFAFSNVLKMDSSFIVGNFDVWDHQTGQTVKKNILSKETLEFMRDEILADYGFIFKNPQQTEQFKYAPWYKPSIESYDEIYSKAFDVDKHNLDFLNRLIGSTPSRTPI